MKKKSANSNLEKEEKEYLTEFYPGHNDDDSLYNELKELRESLSKEFSYGLIKENPIPEFSKEKPEKSPHSMGRDSQNKSSKSNLQNISEPLKTVGLLEDKLEILKDEIEDINRNLEGREKIEKDFNDLLDEEIKELKRQLYEIPNWEKGDKKNLEFIKLELFRQICSLSREKRLNKLNFWKDKIFEKRERRNLLFEYKSLKTMNKIGEED
jgi:hypothetical protein